MSCNCGRPEMISALPVAGVCPCTLVAEARTWIGTPWQHQGRRKRIGVDCLGMVIESLRAVGAIGPEYDLSDWTRTDYARNPRGEELLAAIRRHCQRLAGPLPGSLLVFRFGNAYRHVGLYLGEAGQGARLLHADGSLSVQRVVEVGYSGNWPRFTEGAYALPGIAYGAFQ